MTERVSIKGLFNDLQNEMAAHFRTLSRNVTHPTAKGAAGENLWISWLNKYLPNRYSIDSAFVIDHEGNISEFIDAVIFDQQYTPFVFNREGCKYIPAESVYAAFEIKPELNKGYIDYAGGKIQSVRKLKRTSAEIVHAGGKIAEPKKPFRILGGILAINSGWNPPLGESFESALNALTDDYTLEIGCVINEGGFMIKTKDGLRLSVLKSTKEEALLFFFLNLFMELQRLGTVPAMDVLSYAKALESM